VKRRSVLLAWLCLAGLLTPIITRILADTEHTLAWLIDLASHWQWVFLGGLLLFGTIAAWCDKRLAFLLLAAPLTWFTASERAPATSLDAPILKVAAANVGLGNQEPEALLNWLDAKGIDLVALSEVTPTYAQALQTMSSFDYQHIVPRSGPFGLALLSRHPLVEPKVLQDADNIPRIQATVLWQEQPLTVTALHPMPPLSAHYHYVRNERLRAAAQEAATTTRPGVLLGDLNASPWSAAMLGLTEAGYRRATGLQPTWPAVMQGLVGIPIDQILVSDHWGVRDAGNGPTLASDHIPVWASLSLRSAKPGN
jgi:endonuclease/exonuclease/phosphatase (EEP) superfamily protein YafD